MRRPTGHPRKRKVDSSVTFKPKKRFRKAAAKNLRDLDNQATLAYFGDFGKSEPRSLSSHMSE